MMQNNEAMYPRFPVYKRSEGERAEGKKKKKKERVRGRARGMPHVEQCDLMLFPSNIHKQEQTNFTAQSHGNFLFTLKLDSQDKWASPRASVSWFNS